MSLRLWAALLVFAVACAAESEEPATALRHSEREARRPLPIRASLNGPEHPQPGARIGVVLQLHRAARFSAPVQVSLRLPTGVRALDPADRSLPSVSASDVELVWGLELSSMPREDLVAIVDARSSAAGFHQELRYRFGRPRPRIEVPSLTPFSLTVGGRSWGPSVDVSATPAAPLPGR